MAESGFRVRWDRVTVLVAVVLTLGLLTVRWATAADTHAAAHAEASPRTAVPAAPPCPAVTGEPVRAAPALPAEPQHPTVALTFDDGPGADTPKVLEVLRRFGVHATFFVIGKQASANPATVRSVLAAQHQVGNHSWSHHAPAAATGWRKKTVDAEIKRTNRLLKTLAEQNICWFRPPAGITKGLAASAIAARQAIVLWSVDTRDWAVQRPGIPASAATKTIVRNAMKGLRQSHPVLLMHDGGGRRNATVAALPGIIEAFHAHGYAFVRMDGL
jgi:peptidoglycan/xylan/chitin deacetylase (PgdA/CDA1 family)